MTNFTAEAFTLLSIGLSVLGLRICVRTRTMGMRNLEWDDYFMIAAAFLYSAETALAYTVGAYWQGLANNGMTNEERKALDTRSQEYLFRVNGSKTQVTGWVVYITLLWTMKAAMCVFYLRLTDGLKIYRSRVYAGILLIFTTWAVVLLSILLGCHPLHKYWQINPDPGNHCQPAVSRINLFVTVILNALTDAYLLSIPMPMFWSVRIPTRKKIGLITLFSGGAFVMTAGVLRCVLILRNPSKGAEQAGYWAVRETFVAVVTTNLPVVIPFMQRKLSPILGSISSTSRLNNGTCGRGDGRNN
ncbi:hypothetical protein EDB81DRAFT_848667 [Dactylonectria macrodidyma]|uniref:Rhodopsin domain-containing protein n=1 Tax=Dactylonectria macrodidyma TaxID=307937 RepID=A0A9P9D6W0_9HYPO|nr:hypothetical protein EDB81DRAFT_848667 [Dactylonectria macrodidyma]